MSFGETVKILRKQKGMTQDELGELLGIKKAAVQKIESGTVQSVKISNIKTICEFFDVSPTNLLCEKNDILKREVQLLEEIEMMYGRESVKILQYFTTLNETGQAKAVDYCEDLSNLNYYLD